MYQKEIDNLNFIINKKDKEFLIIEDRFIRIKQNAKYLKKAN
jgi:hypothetical protein